MIRLLSKVAGPAAAALILTLATGVRADAPSRVVSVGGAVTEIVYALGQEHRLAARDTTSNYPAAALQLPDVGYIRRLAPEGLLSVDPDLILAEEGAGPIETLDLLKQSQIPVVPVPAGFDQMVVLDKIAAVAEALGVPGEGATLAAKVDTDITNALTDVTPTDTKVLFVLSFQGGRVMASGTNSPVDTMIAMAGAKNAASGFEGFKLMSDEAIISAAPDVILIMDRSGKMGIEDSDLLHHPGIAATPAGQKGAIVRMDGMLLTGFSVRTGEAIRTLSRSLHAIWG